MELLLSPTSPYARAVRIALMLKGLDAECSTRWVDPASNTPELIDANPLCRVPTLVLDDGNVLTETLLILQYLDRRVPDPSLIPNATALQEMSLAGVAIGLLDSALWIMTNKKFLGAEANVDNPLADRRRQAIERTIERLAVQPPHAVGSTPGMGQILLQVALEYLEFRLPELKAIERSKLEAWGKPLRQLEAFQLTEFYQPT